MKLQIDFANTLNNAISFANDLSNLVEYQKGIINNYKGFGVVYFIYLINKTNESATLVYIGKSKGYLFKTRLRNHFHKKHPKTGSKLSLVQTELAKGNELKLKFLKITPESFRNTIEEELIAHFQPIWNIQKKKP